MPDSRMSASDGGKSLGTLNDVRFFTVDDRSGEEGKKEGERHSREKEKMNVVFVRNDDQIEEE